MTEDPLSAVDLFHFMNWRLRCLEADGMEFQRLFEKVMQRLEPETFVKVRPYGNLGDRKTDGLLFDLGTAYQVYSPNLLRLAEVEAKIREDLAGAVAFWGEKLRRWVFVYNASRGVAGGGVAADVYRLLQREQEKYETLEIDQLSDEALWERLRELDPRKRHEFLGAPPAGWEGLFVPPPATPDEEMDGLEASRIVIRHDTLGPADRRAVLEALHPERPFGAPLRLAPSVDEYGWVGAAAYQAKQVLDIVERAADHLSRFAVFPLSEIALLVHLGLVLSDTKDVKLFQFHRDRSSWRWQETEEEVRADTDFQVAGIPGGHIDERIEVAIRVSLSARVLPEVTAEVVGELPVEIDFSVAAPSREWLRSPNQVVEFRRGFRRVLDELIAQAPRCSRLHLFLAVPGPVAVATGQAINPRMTPAVQLYHYDMQKTPKYEPVLALPL